jgi:hypothetical protein
MYFLLHLSFEMSPSPRFISSDRFHLASSVSQLLDTLVLAEFELTRRFDGITNLKFSELFVGGDEFLDVNFQ